MVQKECLAIITARGGSKRIPRKNIKDFLGKPIIHYPIDAAIKSKVFDEIMVSTDDQEIADFSLKAGAKVPFLRSPNTSGDYSSTAEVILEVLEKYIERGQTFKFVCCIYPTAPFLQAQALIETYSLLKSEKVQSVVPVVRFSFPIQRAVKIENNRMKMFQPEHIVTRSQDLTPAYHDVGQFYWLETESFLKNKKLYTEDTIAYKMDEMMVQDIDTPEDWAIAEMKFKLINNQ